MNFHKQNKNLGISFLSALTQGRKTLKVVYLEDIRLCGVLFGWIFFFVKTDNNIFNPSASHIFFKTVESFQLKLSKDIPKEQTL